MRRKATTRRLNEARATYLSLAGASHPKTIELVQACKTLQMPAIHRTSAAQTRIQDCACIAVHGLTSSPQFNHCRGHVISFDESKQRYGVRLDDGKELFLRPACVLQIPQVNLIGAGHEGAHGCLVRTNEEEGLYTIELAGAALISVPRESVVLPAGTWVRLAVLVQKPELNDQCGAVVLFDQASSRYKVSIGTSMVRIKPANVRLA